MCFSTFFTQQKLKTPGYLGKRFTAEFNMGVAYMHTTKIHDGAYEKRKVFRGNMHPEITFAYTIKRNMDLGFKIGYDRVKLSLPDLPFENINRNNNYVYSADLSIQRTVENENLDNQSNFTFLNETSVGQSFNYQLFLRFYNKKYIAPIGFYHQFSIGINRISIISNRADGYFNINPSEIVEIRFLKYNLYEFSYFFGNKKLLKNNMYINTGIELSIFNKGKLAKFANSKYINTNSDIYNRYIPRKLANEIMLSQLLEFKIGIGKIF